MLQKRRQLLAWWAVNLILVAGVLVFCTVDSSKIPIIFKLTVCPVSVL